MQRIKKAGTIMICAFFGLGFLMALMVSVSYALRSRGITNPLISFFSQSVSADRSWIDVLNGREGKYSRKRNLVEKYEFVTDGIERMLEDYCTSALPGSRFCRSFSQQFRKNILQTELSDVPGELTNQEYAEQAFEQLQLFSEYLGEQGICFLYVQIPYVTRINSYLSNSPYPSSEFDRWDRFSSLMEQSDISFLDLTKNVAFMENVSLDVSDHWMPKDGLAASGLIAEQINDLFGYRFDCTLFDSSRYDNLLLSYPEMLTRIEEEFGYQFEFPIPRQSPCYEVIDSDRETVRGDFAGALLHPKAEWDRRGDDGTALAYHNFWRLQNGSWLRIRNLSDTNNPGKRILFLGDSFTWPISAYLSQDVEELAALHPRHFNGYVRSFIEDYQPDLVIWTFVEEQVGIYNIPNFNSVN